MENYEAKLVQFFFQFKAPKEIHSLLRFYIFSYPYFCSERFFENFTKMLNVIYDIFPFCDTCLTPMELMSGWKKYLAWDLKVWVELIYGHFEEIFVILKLFQYFRFCNHFWRHTPKINIVRSQTVMCLKILPSQVCQSIFIS